MNCRDELQHQGEREPLAGRGANDREGMGVPNGCVGKVNTEGILIYRLSITVFE